MWREVTVILWHAQDMSINHGADSHMHIIEFLQIANLYTLSGMT